MSATKKLKVKKRKTVARKKKLAKKRRVFVSKKSTIRKTKNKAIFVPASFQEEGAVHRINLRDKNYDAVFADAITESIRQSRAQNYLQELPIPVRPENTVAQFADFSGSSVQEAGQDQAGFLSPETQQNPPAGRQEKSRRKLFTKAVLYSILGALILAGIFTAILYVFAVPPTSKYDFGETLDPNCSPVLGDPNYKVNCSVVAPAQYSFSTNDFSGTGDFTTSGTVQAGTLQIGGEYALPTIDGNNGQVLSTNGSGTVSWQDAGSSSMIYPGSGIAVSTGSAWGTSLTDSHANWDAAYTHKTTEDAINGLVFVDGAGNYSAKAIGTDVQAYSAKLASLAGVSNPASASFLKMADDGTISTDISTYLTAYSETDPIVGAITGIVKANGAGVISAATAGTDYLATVTADTPLSGSGTSGSHLTITAADATHAGYVPLSGTPVTNQYLMAAVTSGALSWGQIAYADISGTPDLSGYATKALDNLASVAINTSLLPGTTKSIDLGSTTKTFKDIYIAGTADPFYIKLTGTATATDVITFPDETGTVCTTGSVCANYQPAGSYLIAETDPIVGAITGIVKANGAGVISAATAGTDYQSGTLTATRVPYATGSPGTLTDSANLTFDGTSLTAAGLIGPLKVSSTTGVNLTSTNGVLTMAGLKSAGNNENLTLNFETTANAVAISTDTEVNTLAFNGITLASSTGTLTLGGRGGSNNEELAFDFETTPNKVAIGTGTSVTDITTALSFTAGQLIDSGLSASKPVFTDSNKQLTSTGVLGADQGGTGLSSLTAYAVLAGGTTSTGAFQQVSGLGDAGQVLTSNGAAALPTWQAASGGMINPMDDIGQLIYGGASGTPTKLSAGSSGQVLRSGGAGAPAWSTATYPATGGTSGTLLTSNGTNFVNTTATYPATATGTGTILRANGTNWLATTATYPTTIAAGSTLVANSLNTLSALTSTSGTYVLTNTSGTISWAAGGSGTVTGAGSANRVAYWSGTSALTSSANFTYSGTLLTVGGTGNGGYINITDEAYGYQIDGYRLVSKYGSSPNENLFLGQSGNFYMSGVGNIFAGYYAGVNNYTGNYNIFDGYMAGVNNYSGYNNDFIGYEAGYNNNSGYMNEFIGDSAGYSNYSGSYDVFIGAYSGYNNQYGYQNTAIGSYAGYSNQTGNGNVFLGYAAGSYETGSNAFYVDDRLRANTAGDKANALLYGTFADAAASQTLYLNALVYMPTVYNATTGSSANVYIDPQGMLWRSTSSLRYKYNVQPLEEDFSKILQLQPKSFTYKGSDMQGMGYIAEDLDAMGLKDLVGYDGEGRPDSVNYDKISVYLTEIVKQQQQDIDALNVIAGINSGGSWGSGALSAADAQNPIISAVQKLLTDTGVVIQNGITSIKNLAVDTLAVKTARINQMEMVDRATGDIYCTWIENGEWQKSQGDCSSIGVVSATGNEVESSTPSGPDQAITQQTQQIVEQAAQVVQQAQQASSAAQQAVQQSQDAVNQAAQQAVQQVQQSVVSVASIDDIAVNNGTAFDEIGLPESVNVTLLDGTSQDLPVVWDSGTPEYDETTGGTYAFAGALTLSGDITNSKKLKAEVNILVQPAEEQESSQDNSQQQESSSQGEQTQEQQQINEQQPPTQEQQPAAEQPPTEQSTETPTPPPTPVPAEETPAPVDQLIQDAASSLLNGVWNFFKWLFNSGSDAISSVSIVQKSAAGLMKAGSSLDSLLQSFDIKLLETNIFESIKNLFEKNYDKNVIDNK